MPTPETVLALSLYQPWATLAAIGAKLYETRHWATAYRGPIAIHATQMFPSWARELCSESPFREVLVSVGILDPEQLPRGAILAVGRLAYCVGVELVQPSLRLQERAFGDYTPGRFAWRLENMRLLPTPVPARGWQRLWDCTAVLYQ